MLWLLLTVIILGILFLARRDKKMILLYNQLPCDTPQWPFIGHIHKYWGSSESKMQAIQLHGKEATSKGGLMGLWQTNILYIMVTDAEASEYVLRNCLEKDFLTKLTTFVVGNGSIFAPVPIWRPRRKVLAPSFNLHNLNGFVKIFSKQSMVLVDKLKSVAGRNPVPMWKYFETYAMDALCETTMGVSVGAQKNPNSEFFFALRELFELAVQRMSKPWLHSDFIFTKIHNKVIRYRDIIYNFIEKIIAEKRRSTKRQPNNDPEQKKDYLKTFIDMIIEESSNNGGYTNIELREEALVVLTAGTDTSAVGTSFTTLLLSRHPNVQAKVYQELQDVFGDSDRSIVAEDLPRLKYLEAVIKESIRLYPPVPAIAREVDSDLKLPSGITLVKGCGALINIWAVHRNPRYWGFDADEFKPERFIEAPPKHSAAFMAFSYGPRGCLGFQYAYMSMKTTIANILRRYRLLPAPDPETGRIPFSHEPLRLKFEVMLRHIDDYKVILENRTK